MASSARVQASASWFWATSATSLYAGRTFAKSGIWGRTYRRDEQPFGYWSTLAVYAALAAALLTVF